MFTTLNLFAFYSYPAETSRVPFRRIQCRPLTAQGIAIILFGRPDRGHELHMARIVLQSQLSLCQCPSPICLEVCPKKSPKKSMFWCFKAHFHPTYQHLAGRCGEVKRSKSTCYPIPAQVHGWCNVKHQQEEFVPFFSWFGRISM